MKRLGCERYYSGLTTQAIRKCTKFRKYTTLLFGLCAFAQLLIDASITNVLCVLIVLIASIFTFQFIFRSSVLCLAPLPALVVVGFNIATMSGALVAQTLSMRSLVFNLRVPEITFSTCAVYQISLLLAFYLFVSSSILPYISQLINCRVFNFIGIMRAPRSAQLWLMGIIGSSIIAWSSTVRYGVDAIQYGDVGGKFLFGLIYIAYAPFLIPIRSAVFPDGQRRSRLCGIADDFKRSCRLNWCDGCCAAGREFHCIQMW